MALEGIPGVTPRMRDFVAQVRLFVRDHPELNRLVRGEESSDRQIAWAVCDAMSNFNGTPPLTAYIIDDLLLRNEQSLLTRMTICALFESIAALQLRNHINYSNGGLNVGVNDKAPMILQWLQYYRSYTEQKLLRVKVALNIESILGPCNQGVNSELWAVNASYAAY